jgi:hypothetical protein
MERVLLSDRHGDPVTTRVQFGTLLRDSYARLTETDVRSEAFLTDFYRLFLAKNPAIRERFRDTDMKRQRTMLRRSLQHMLAFSVTLTADDYLFDVGRRHSQSGLDITADLYAVWLDALIQAARLHDPRWSRAVEVAWRVGMAAGIEFMKSCHGGLWSDRPTGST